MSVDAFGYSRDYAHQCAAWTINNLGRARKQCALPVNQNIDHWIYLCTRHYDLIFREFENRVDNLNSERVANMSARLSAVAEFEQQMLREERETYYTFSEEDYDARRRAQTVYFIRCEEYVKIGVSYEPAKRLDQLRKGGALFPRRMDIASAALIVTEPGGFEREQELHAMFAHLRHTGEWFTEAPELTEYIESLSERTAA